MDRKPNSIKRRTLLAGAVGLTAAAALGAKPIAGKYRVGLIGHTGRGGYGHGLDKLWRDMPLGKIVAVADPNPRGLAQTVKRFGADKGYSDYRKMLDESKIDILTVGPTHIDKHCEMVLAAAERKVRGIYIEKPLCRTLEEADKMVAACDKNKVKLAMAHQSFYVPTMSRVAEIIRSGKLGRVLEFRGRCKEDHRGGGIGLWVLGTRILAMMKRFGGNPISCTAAVLQDKRPITAKDVKNCQSYGIGPLAGDEIHAMYRLAGGAVGYFDSVKRAGAGWPSRYGLQIFGTKGVLDIHSSELFFPSVYYLDDPLWYPGQSGKKWVPVTSAGIGKPEPLKGENSHHGGNVLAVKDLISSIEKDRQPVANLSEARANLEMIAAVYESVRLGEAAPFPLKNRKNPLAMLEKKNQ
ncbi:MAG: Gfo/Idh/MocA family oxidoreductase [Phycisphaerae bacterium]|jgi:predicted dehydrogenase|nr:Gfo/Idh/MocA family oxidoreductase [Phycisphaerae bacterium]